MNVEKLDKSTILIVDDQPKNLDVLIHSLERFGFDFMVAQNGNEAIKRVAQLKPDMILLDILMPGMDGFEVCKVLKDNKLYCDIPVVFMSALSETVDKLKGFELGAVDYITKPFQLDEIIARIKSHLTIAKLRQQLYEANQSLGQKVQQRTQELKLTNDTLVQEVGERKSLERRYRLLLETLQEGIWAIGQQLETIYVNPRMAEILGCHVDDFFRLELRQLVHLEFKECISAILAQEVITRENFDITLTLATGNSLFLAVTSTPLVDHKECFLGILLAVTDITERKIIEDDLKQKEQILERQNEKLKLTNKRMVEINRELRLAKDKAEEGDRLKSSFLANLSHEIRTPMNAILGYAELLQAQDHESIEERESYITNIIAGTQQLLSIITDIINVSKLESNQLDIIQHPFAIDKLMAELYDQTLNDLLVEKKQDIQLSVKNLLPKNSLLIGDQDRLKNIMSNLLRNSVKFTQKGAIEFGCARKGHVIEFYVHDTGIGIAQEAQDIIFERFRQVEENYTRQFGGTGLGLAISKGFVELMGGKIWLQSALGEGSTFYFSLPYQAEEVADMVLDEQKSLVRLNISQKKVLIVEDEEINLVYMQELLSRCNANVLVARNGQEALAVLTDNPDVRLILMDVKMPVMNGYEALTHIRKKWGNVPVIAQTAYAMAEDREQALRAGFDAYLAKPIGAQMLFSLLAEHLK